MSKVVRASRLQILPTSGTELSSAVAMEEYKRLLGLPRSKELEGDLLDRAQNAREWYAKRGDPFVASTTVELKSISSPVVHLADGTYLTSAQLSERLRAGEAHGLVVLVATAGTAVAEEVAEHWANERPDEAFFLDRFAVAVTEHLIQWSSTFLCRASEPSNETLLPHLSPGCGHWDLADQHKLMALFTNDAQLGPLKLLPSGALHPQHSVIAALGVTHRKSSATPRDICRTCDLDPCAFRRAPFSGSF
ncbi:hypothetical protein L0222_04785 [bacterium]|nr:hypothetical protein [bacterium]MCI0606702.1 hypothetical protein [bacterium]